MASSWKLPGGHRAFRGNELLTGVRARGLSGPHFLPAGVGLNTQVVERVLDLGCGYGRTLPALAARAALVVGIDTSAADALFSSYAAGFWGPRLAWFERQAAAGLIGEIDHERSGEGVIICRDGLRLPLLRPAEFAALVAGLEVAWQALVVDGSSQFYLLEKHD